MKRVKNVGAGRFRAVALAISRLVLGLVVTAGLSAGTAVAQLVMIPGSHQLAPDSLLGQTVDLFVDNQGTSPVTVDAFNFILQIGDGGPANGGSPAPAITAVDLHTGTAFAGNFSPQVDQGSTPQVAQWFITTAGGSVTLPVGQSKLGTVTLTTQGFSTPNQSWGFNLEFNVPSSGFPITPSDYVFQGASLPASLLAGQISIVPEPSASAVVGGLLLAFAGLWRWKRSRVCICCLLSQ
jgi:hypothetical protein